MQTFLPYPDFNQSAKILDYRRLGKQRVEAWQILNTLTGKSDGWKNHPAVRMWKGYEPALAQYGIAMCDEWILRGYKDTLRPRFISTLPKNYNLLYYYSFTYPMWWGNEQFHRSHRSNLLRKKPEFYREFWPKETDTLSYVWPV